MCKHEEVRGGRLHCFLLKLWLQRISFYTLDTVSRNSENGENANATLH